MKRRFSPLSTALESVHVGAEAARSFMRNSGFTAASSLAFYTLLSLIPGMFLLTYLKGFSEGLSHLLVTQARAMIGEFIPTGTGEVIDGLMSIGAPTHAFGLITLAAMLWSISPLISELRSSMSVIFRVRSGRFFFISKLIDVLIGTGCVAAFIVIAAAAVLLDKQVTSITLRRLLPMAMMTGSVYVVYRVFGGGGRRPAYVLFGAFVTSAIWFAVKPAFDLFLSYNEGFGLAFGSLKSLYVAVFWIYLSHCLLLFGAEFAAWLGRKDAVLIKRLMEGKRVDRLSARRGLIASYAAGETIVREGEHSSEMYYIVGGEVSVTRQGAELAVLRKGNFIGEISFLLGEDRSADVTAIGDVDLVIISRDNYSVLTHEFPDMFNDILKSMAQRLKHTTQMIERGA